ncbi:MAG TPA: outer membrane beta-barrel protein [Pseudolabrys sp.]|nr:outer membrane beta-barrel protein [Pseudolabrys sp.]
MNARHIRFRSVVDRAVLPAAALLIGLSFGPPVRAADWLGGDALRGSLAPAPLRWDGVYFGGAFGVGNPHADFGDSAHDMISYMLRNTTLENEQHPEDWTALGADNGRWTSYGGFVGYNVTWDGGIVLGGEIGYNYVSSDGLGTSDSMTRRVTLTTGTDDVTITADSAIRLKDYATFRGRVGWDAGAFLPYAFLGLAVGRFNYLTNASVVVTGSDTYSNSDSNGKEDAISAGLDVGLGVDVALTSNIFLRGEWEYLAFAPLSGIRYTSNVGRAGIGVKF